MPDMNSKKTLRPLAMALAIAIIWAGSPQTSPPAVSAAAPAGPANPLALADDSPAPGTPCDLVARRSVEPLVVEEGGTLEVSVDYEYQCSHQRRRINYFLLVEASEALRGPGVDRDLLEKLKQALSVFVNRVDYGNGSTGGLTLYAEDYSNRVTLRGDDAGRKALLDAIRRISVEPIGNSAGAPAAIRDATERLPTGQSSDAINVLIVIDAGAPVSTRPLIDYETACGAAKKAGVVLSVIGLETAGTRGLGCASPGWGRVSREADGSDLEEIFDQLADLLISGKGSSSNKRRNRGRCCAAVLVRWEEAIAELLPTSSGPTRWMQRRPNCTSYCLTSPKQPDLEEYGEWFSQGFDYQAGSAEPFEPDQLIGQQYAWTFDRTPRAGSRSIRYRVDVETGPGNRVEPLSVDASVALFFSDGSRANAPADNPEICVYKAGRSDFCAGHGQPTPVATEEPTAGPATSEPSPTPPLDPTTEPTTEPTSPPPTATDAPTTLPPSTIFLPLSLRSESLDALAPPATAVAPSPTTEPSATPEPEPTDPPTALPSPTATSQPTTEPSPTLEPEPSPTPTRALDCQELLTNGDFEAGARNWRLTVTTQEQQASRSIQHRSKLPIEPHGGDYAAWLGGLDDTRFELESDALARLRGSDVVSASLRARVALIQDGGGSSRPGDVLSWHLGEGRTAHIVEADLADGDFEAQRRWQLVSADLTERLQAGGSSRLRIQFDTDGRLGSWVYIDDIQVTACRAMP